MKILSRALLLLFILVGVLVAVSNPQTVELALWPLPQIILMPVYLLVVGLLLLGVLIGLGIGWWAARHHRRRAREATGEAARLAREATHLRNSLAAQQAAPSPAGPPSPGQRAIERQSALVAPDIAAPTTRGPFS
jgi:uncharacterized integral membrane protein